MVDTNPANDSATDEDVLLCFSETVVVPDGRVTTSVIGAGATAWYEASLKAGSSYSVEFGNTTESGPPPGTLTMFSGSDGCSQTSTLSVRDTTAIDPSGSTGVVRMSFTATGMGTFFRARLVNGFGSPIPMTFTWSDTTMYSPAWTTNGSFDTFYSFQNTTSATIAGTLTLFGTTGAVLGTLDLSVPAGQTVTTNTSALGMTRNRTGTARLTHDGSPGSIVAEAAIANFTISPAYVQPVKFQAVREAR
jgi:hypothetical protein